MKCQCGSDRILRFTDVCTEDSLLFMENNDARDIQGTIPDNLNIGSGYVIRFRLCLNCGRIQGEWPAPKHSIEKTINYN